jgi:hypothetical protein
MNFLLLFHMIFICNFILIVFMLMYIDQRSDILIFVYFHNVINIFFKFPYRFKFLFLIIYYNVSVIDMLFMYKRLDNICLWRTIGFWYKWDVLPLFRLLVLLNKIRMGVIFIIFLYNILHYYFLLFIFYYNNINIILI